MISSLVFPSKYLSPSELALVATVLLLFKHVQCVLLQSHLYHTVSIQHKSIDFIPVKQYFRDSISVCTWKTFWHGSVARPSVQTGFPALSSTVAAVLDSLLLMKFFTRFWFAKKRYKISAIQMHQFPFLYLLHDAQLRALAKFKILKNLHEKTVDRRKLSLIYLSYIAVSEAFIVQIHRRITISSGLTVMKKQYRSDGVGKNISSSICCI